MNITDIIWTDSIINKLAVKHHVEPYEVEERYITGPRFALLKEVNTEEKKYTWHAGERTLDAFL